MLDNWDESFDDMVDQGLAQPQDKDRLKQSITKYRNMMADTSLSVEEKEKRRREMIASGEMTVANMDYLDRKAEGANLFASSAVTDEKIIDQGYKIKSDDGKKSNFSVFNPVYSSIDPDTPTIKTDIKLGTQFVSAANPPLASKEIEIVNEKVAQIQRPAPTKEAVVASAGWG